MKRILLFGITVLSLTVCGCKHVESVPERSFESAEITESRTEEHSENAERKSEESRYEGKYTVEELKGLYGENTLETEYDKKGNIHILKGKIGKDTVIDNQQAEEFLKTLSTITGIPNPDKELILTNTYSNGYTLCYTFHQVYHNTLVYDSGILLNVNYEDCIPDYLKIETVPEEVLKKTNFAETGISEEELKEQYGGTVTKYIYALEKYEEQPIIVYEVTPADGETLVIHSETGEEMKF